MTPRRQILPFGLVIVFLTLNSLTYPQLLAHAFHHSQHTAETHAQPLCFWVCSAGQMEETSNPFHIANIGPVGTIALTSKLPTPILIQPVHLARGPPSTFLS